MSQGTVQAIWIKRMKRGPMDAVPSARFAAGKGIVGNANQGGRRQVTLLEAEVWQKLMQDFDSTLDPATRRANILIQGISLAQSRGRILQLGAIQIRILGETKPCERMDEALSGLKDAMYAHWQGGAFGEVLTDGELAVHDVVCWQS